VHPRVGSSSTFVLAKKGLVVTEKETGLDKVTTKLDAVHKRWTWTSRWFRSAAELKKRVLYDRKGKGGYLEAEPAAAKMLGHSFVWIKRGKSSKFSTLRKTMISGVTRRVHSEFRDGTQVSCVADGATVTYAQGHSSSKSTIKITVDAQGRTTKVVHYVDPDTTFTFTFADGAIKLAAESAKLKVSKSNWQAVLDRVVERDIAKSLVSLCSESSKKRVSCLQQNVIGKVSGANQANGSIIDSIDVSKGVKLSEKIKGKTYWVKVTYSSKAFHIRGNA
jgi:hypothetical protein